MLTLSDGNAYFVEALVADGAHAAPATAATHLPGGLRDVLIPRIRMMSDEAQEVLRAAATAGRHVSHRLLAAAAEQPERQLNSALRECVDQQLLTVRPGADTYTFRHALAREAVYEDLLPGERIRLHQSLASALESDPSLAYTEAGSVATELAHHWSEAGEPARALAASVAAGRDAADVCAFGESERQFSRALRLWERVPDPERLAAMSRLELLRRAADAARWAGHVEAAIAATRDALASVDPSLGVERAAVLERLGRYLREAGDSDGTLRAYEEADRLLVDQPPSALRAGVRAARAGARLQAGEYSLGLLLGREAVQMARAVGSAREEGRALNTTGVALTMTGHPDEGVDAVRNALAIAQEHGDLEDLHRAYANLTFVLENAGRLEEALKVARQGLDQGRRIGLGPEGSCAHSFRIAILLFELGRWTEAGKMAVEALEREIPARFALYFELLLAELDIYHGRFDNADRRLASIRPTVARLNEPQSTGALHACLAELAIWRRERGPARTTIADGLKAVCDAEDAPQVLRLCAYGLRAEADEAQRLSDLGQGDSGPARTARDVGDDLWTRAEQAGTGPDGAPPLPEVSVLTLLCRAEHARLHGSNDPDVWARVAAGWRGLQRLYPSAYAEWRWAEALADGPHRDRGRITPVLRNAYRTAEALKAGPLLREIEVLALRAGDIKLDPPPTRPDRPEPAPAPYRLTPREQEVLHYVGLGFTNKQIAKKLRIEEKTVSVHVTHILTKLDVQNRVQAAGIAHRLGLGTTE